jgi:hypothetical protein
VAAPPGHGFGAGTMQDDDFEWDDTKAAANWSKHALTFDTATLVFDDLFVVVRPDRRMAYGEDRWLAIGMARERLIAVVFTWRGDRVRIMSARGATPQEKRNCHEAAG